MLSIDDEVPANASGAMLVMPVPGIVRMDNLIQLKNAIFPIFETLVGMVTFVRA